MAGDLHDFDYDLEILDRYQKFSAEIVRLSVAALSVIGFLAAFLAKDGCSNLVCLSVLLERCWPRFLLVAVFWSLGLAIAGALAHRYFSTDSMATYLQRLRTTAPDKIGQLREETQRRLDASTAFVGLASAFFALGGILVVLLLTFLVAGI